MNQPNNTGLPRMQQMTFESSMQAFEHACHLRGYNAADLMPKGMDAMPEWLRSYTTATIARLIIAEAINNGRKPLIDGEEVTWEPYFYITKTAAGFGFSHTGADSWLTYAPVGARLKFFSYEDANYFADNFQDLHAAVLSNI